MYRSFLVSSKALAGRRRSGGDRLFFSFNNHRDAAFKLLGLKSFSEVEIKKSFDRLKLKSGDNEINVVQGMEKVALEDNVKDLDKARLEAFALVVTGDKTKSGLMFNFDEYKKKVVAAGEALDSRVWNLGISFLFTGVSVGVIIPCMPLMVAQLGIPPAEFGAVIAAFGLSKLLGNVPSGYMVDKYGRKPMLVAGLSLCALSLGSLGLTLLPGFGTPWLIGCRFFSGLGVSAFLAGGHMFMSDISTPLNRTRTIAPVMAGFSGGAALGPALGGLLIAQVGISYTYATVGGMFGALALANYLFQKETMVRSLPSKEPSTAAATAAVVTAPAPAPPSLSRGVIDSFSVAYNAWKGLVSKPRLGEVLRLNGAYWFAYTGSQMTLLPLFMVSPLLHLSAFEIGGCFAFMSSVAFAASQPSAIIADKYGKALNISLGGTLLAGAMLALPHVGSSLELVAVLFPMALGATIMNSTPTALVSDTTTHTERAQAMSLLRTCGDVGLLFGAGFSGMMATVSSIETAFQLNGALMGTSVAWFAFRSYQQSKAAAERKID